jgi:hypothetical protein
MAELTIKDYHGAVSKCAACSNADPETPMHCPQCFCRGYVAECLACKGAGQTIVPVAGGSGEMKSTCSVCGGKGKFGVNKPADWDILHPAEVAEVEVPSLPAQEPKSEPVDELVAVE